MKLSEFKSFVNKFKNNPVPGRHLFIWNGNLNQLLDYIPTDILFTLDMVDLVHEIDSTNSDEKLFSAFRKLIANRLTDLASKVKKQAILVVKNNYFFPRYNIPVSLFYNYFINDRLSVVFQIDNYFTDQRLPDFVIFKSDRTLEYFQKLTDLGDLITED